MIDERIVENNIFNFATNELSQDAFICWCLNWINMPVRDDNESGRQFGSQFLSRLLNGAYDVSKVNRVYIFRLSVKCWGFHPTSLLWHQS